MKKRSDLLDLDAVFFLAILQIVDYPNFIDGHKKS